MGSSRIKRAMAEVDKYLDGLSYNYVTSNRADRLYEKLFHDIASIVLRFYADVDVTANTELSVVTDTSGKALRTTITGYVKVGEGQYLQIEKAYLPKENKDEESI